MDRAPTSKLENWLPTTGGPAIDVTDPSTGAIVGRVRSFDREAIEAAIERADAALGGWSSLAARERSAILCRWFDLITANTDDLARIMTAEQGKPLAEARGEIAYAASFIEWFAEEGKRLYGDIIPAPTTDKRITVLKQPVGACAAITPWNFPAAMITRKAGPALAAGCTMIVKPATQTPLTALAIVALAHEAGVLQIVTGPSRLIGEVLTSSEKVRKLSFTGSTEVGRQLMAQCAGTIKRISLELGGNAPFIVFDDADLDAAVDGAIAAKFRNAGQTCVCANRIYAQAGIYDTFVERLSAKVATLKVGDGFEPGVDIGPLIDAAAVSKVREHVADALAKGGRLVTGAPSAGEQSHFLAPMVIADSTESMLVAHEETFGPLAPVFRFETEEDAIRLANDTEYGLAAYFYTRDHARAWRVVERLECGMVGHNTGLISNEVVPFGGVKQSGLGREGSRYGIDEYIEIKYWCSAI
ncbi:NAD-dependent succinate-semialdehyde dehydrogenase [Bradyrhizobium sp. AZCC 2289]|uniref:NAD-dependent succinate-semialdehyde dehydrogenase n=1 Tax=Bradyrhizobium sp. AZCC 2289 TaxID=3117026 RepID=UPI002FEF6493